MGVASTRPAGATLLTLLRRAASRLSGGKKGNGIQSLITRNYPSNVIPGAQIRRKSGASVCRAALMLEWCLPACVEGRLPRTNERVSDMLLLTQQRPWLP